MKRSGCAISGRLIRLGMTLALIGILLTAAEAFAGEPGDGRPGTTGSVWVKKLVDRAVIRLGDTSNDMLPFLIMAGLLAVAAFLMWRFPGNQTVRRVVQTVSAAAFIVGIHPCGCMTRDLVLGIGWLSASDLTAFKYMIVFVTAGAFAAVVGRSFCGWLCPVGYAQELISLASRRLYRAIDGGRIARVVLHVSIFFGAGLVIYCAIFISLKLPQAARNGDLSLLVPQFTSETLLPYGAAYLAAAVIGAFGALLRSVLLTKYLFDVEILVAIMYAFYRTKPGTYSVIGYAMAFFVMGLALIVLIILGDDSKDRFFKKFRYALWLCILAIYAYQMYNVGPMCLFFQGSTEWPILVSFGGVFLLSILLSMSWCRYMCPEGAALGLLASRASWQINRNDKCTGCGVCNEVCPLHCIEYGIRDRKSCIYCMKCVDACPVNALELINEIGRERQTIPYPPPPEFVPGEAR